MKKSLLIAVLLTITSLTFSQSSMADEEIETPTEKEVKDKDRADGEDETKSSDADSEGVSGRCKKYVNQFKNKVATCKNRKLDRQTMNALSVDPDAGGTKKACESSHSLLDAQKEAAGVSARYCEKQKSICRSACVSFKDKVYQQKNGTNKCNVFSEQAKRHREAAGQVAMDQSQSQACADASAAAKTEKEIGSIDDLANDMYGDGGDGSEYLADKEQEAARRVAEATNNSERAARQSELDQIRSDRKLAELNSQQGERYRNIHDDSLMDGTRERYAREYAAGDKEMRSVWDDIGADRASGFSGRQEEDLSDPFGASDGNVDEADTLARGRGNSDYDQTVGAGRSEEDVAPVSAEARADDRPKNHLIEEKRRAGSTGNTGDTGNTSSDSKGTASNGAKAGDTGKTESSAASDASQNAAQQAQNNPQGQQQNPQGEQQKPPENGGGGNSDDGGTNAQSNGGFEGYKLGDDDGDDLLPPKQASKVDPNIGNISTGGATSASAANFDGDSSGGGPGVAPGGFGQAYVPNSDIKSKKNKVLGGGGSEGSSSGVAEAAASANPHSGGATNYGAARVDSAESSSVNDKIGFSETGGGGGYSSPTASSPGDDEGGGGFSMCQLMGTCGGSSSSSGGGDNSLISQYRAKFAQWMNGSGSGKDGKFKFANGVSDLKKGGKLYEIPPKTKTQSNWSWTTSALRRKCHLFDCESPAEVLDGSDTLPSGVAPLLRQPASKEKKPIKTSSVDLRK